LTCHQDILEYVHEIGLLEYRVAGRSRTYPQARDALVRANPRLQPYTIQNGIAVPRGTTMRETALSRVNVYNAAKNRVKGYKPGKSEKGGDWEKLSEECPVLRAACRT
jgi:hypothetical protein